MKDIKVITIGSATQDVFLVDRDDFTTTRLGNRTVFSRLTLGTKARIDRAIQTTGGGGTNAATTFARSGFETYFIGSIGDDLAGKAVKEALADDSIKTNFVRVLKNESTGYTVLMLAPNGERTALVVKGASKTFAGINFSRIITKEKPDWLYITTLSGDMESLAAITDAAKANGTKVFLNPGDSEIDNIQKLKPILSKVDILSINTEEAERLLGKMRIRMHWQKYLKKGGDFGLKLSDGAVGVIISDGSKGAYFTTGQKLYKVGLYDNEKSVDRTGAGDSFGSGFLARYILSQGIGSALTFASANSSSVVMHIGAKEGIMSAAVKLKKIPIDIKEIKEKR